MRLLKILLISLSMLTCLASPASDAYARKIVILNRVFASAGACGQYENETSERGERVPGNGLMCVIDLTDGVYICGRGFEDQFDSFEILDSSNTCMAVYFDEASFVNAVLSLEGTCKIRINTSNTCYEGILER